jgi:hypothetical protein
MRAIVVWVGYVKIEWRLRTRVTHNSGEKGEGEEIKKISMLGIIFDLMKQWFSLMFL